MLYVFLTSTLAEGVWSASHIRQFTAEKISPSTHWMADILSPSAGRDSWRRGKVLPLAFQPAASCVYPTHRSKHSTRHVVRTCELSGRRLRMLIQTRNSTYSAAVFIGRLRCRQLYTRSSYSGKLLRRLGSGGVKYDTQIYYNVTIIISYHASCLRAL
jgi:hypothetical protein